jgi:ABC-type antimicrobial peptide transport system permease subunit
MSYLFNFTTLVAMLISFFSLTASMFTNIREQSKEIGVLRAMGIPKFWIYRIYAYEAFVVILSSSILGLMIGVVVGWTMTLQRVLFTALPVPFVFPYVLMAIIFGSSVILGILASAIPSRSVLGIPIVQIMKMLN